MRQSYIALGAATFLLAACGGTTEERAATGGLGGEATTSRADVLAEIKGWDEFSTFSEAIEVSDLKNTLAGDGPFTVFAPTDDAFAQLPEGAVDELMRQENRDQLEALLRHHVVEGQRLASNAIPERIEPMEGGEITATMSGGELILSAGEDDDQRARVVGNIPADNGVIHAIDSVLMTNDLRDLLDGQRG